MKTSMSHLLDQMKTRVMENLNIIRKNEQEIRKILAEPLTQDRRIKLNNRRELNKLILLENEENLKIQHSIVSFASRFKTLPDYNEYFSELNLWQNEMERQGHEDDNAVGTNSWDEAERALNQIPKPEKQMKETGCPESAINLNDQSEESLLMLTATGEIAFNNCHPKFNDEVFFNELINYHLAREEYEICASLSRIRV